MCVSYRSGMIASASGALASKARSVGACRWSSWLWDTYTASTRLRSYRSGTGIGYGYHWSRYAGPLHHGSVSSVSLPCRTSSAACPMKSTRMSHRLAHPHATGPEVKPLNIHEDHPPAQAPSCAVRVLTAALAGRSGADLRHARSKYFDV